ncbi:hypothetical protein GIY56_17915 [Paracoccus sp. YIM 132242]|uniref:Uncharacterized protein n=1 Tax=Paracoccus lichenicola TaxID=2665644 RepID=A0A6L6HSL3_9RHOB|nr:hypothetical protein [Paracoccus lichenicola]MTE02167.1 hypothetical protein [Paracoccus lichenicola]
MPKMVRVYIRSVLIGVALSCCFVAALLALDVAHLRHLILNSSVGWLAVIMMIVFNTIVFAGVQFAIAVMAEAETPPPSSGRRAWTGGRLKPAVAVSPASKRRRD